MFATHARRSVESARLGLDAVKSKGKKGAQVGMSGEVEDIPMGDEQRAEVEKKEDEFVGVTEEAVGVMKNVSSRTPPALEAIPCISLPHCPLHFPLHAKLYAKKG